MSLLAASAAGAYLCSEAFVPGVGVTRAQVGMLRGMEVVFICARVDQLPLQYFHIIGDGKLNPSP